ncbi:hypothetical protein SCP_0213420 [Sparassis crispa]|uniref:Uncharacterized protein n=1 Tax=Sparassis crispa TaxID=139825 RepID=A0A401GD75_9APHY|nr:hypothetical protein SCP_0213420 [Sparassis crispa]GBE80139.1 hypothetical protein SCP_0213420 [Sparassis crispa]
MAAHPAKDDFAMGYERLADGKRIKDFITRTVRDAGAIHGDEELTTDQTVEGVGPDVMHDASDAPLPNILFNGQLLEGSSDSADEDGILSVLDDSDVSTSDSESEGGE